MIRDVVRSLVSDCNPHSSAKRSFKDFHAKGATYVNLAYGPELVAKLYFFDPERVRHLSDSQFPQGIVVNPHDHGYSFQTYVIAGEVWNVKYSPVPNHSWYGPARHEFRFYTQFRNEHGRCDWEREQSLEIKGVQHRVPGEHYHSDHEEIHSISVSKKEETILFLLQHRDQNKEYTRLFMPTPKPPDLADLYKPMTPREVEDYLCRALESL